MKRYIYSAKDNKQPQIVPTPTQVKKVGQYLAKNLDGAFKGVPGYNNDYDVYVTVLYQLKEEYGGDPNDVGEMTVDINITTYSNSLRINTITVTPEEKTLGFDLLKPKDLTDLEMTKKVVQWLVGKRLRKAFEGYNILF
jgi:hypothetical protein